MGDGAMNSSFRKSFRSLDDYRRLPGSRHYDKRFIYYFDQFKIKGQILPGKRMICVQYNNIIFYFCNDDLELLPLPVTRRIRSSVLKFSMHQNGRKTPPL